MNKYNFSSPQSSYSQNFSPSSDPLSSLRPKSRASNMISTGSSIVRGTNPDLQRPSYLAPTPTRDSPYKSKFSDPLSPSPDKDPFKSAIGLQNLGNTCYMNAVLQCFCRLPAIRQQLPLLEIITPHRGSKYKGKLVSSFHELAKNLVSGTSSSVYPYKFKRACGEIDSQYLGYQQRDSAEFFRKLIEGIQEETNRVVGKPPYEEMKGNNKENINKIAGRWWSYSLARENSIITDIFLGQYLSVISCPCGHKEISCDTFYDVTLALPAGNCTLKECFQNYSQENKVTEYRCLGCKQVGDRFSTLRFYKLPRVLVIQLKRFTISNGRERKMNNTVSFPEVVDLREFCETGETRFRLQGLCHHEGTLNFGHCYAECMEDGRWYTFDDEKVSPTEIQKQSSYAYLLFYVMV